MRKQKKKREEKEEKKNLYLVLLTSGVIAALITGLFSLFVSYNTNEKLKDIETQKHHYDLQEVRYGKLQEALEYFSKFKIYDPKYIYRFDINSKDFSTDAAMEMYYDSSQDFLSHVLIIIPYLSDEAIDTLEENGVFDVDALKKYDINVNELTDDTKINEIMKEHMQLVNSEFESVCIVIIQALSYDLSMHFTYLQTS